MHRLIIAPHADDEALGCASFLDCNTAVSVLSLNESEFGLSIEDRKKEFIDLSEEFNFLPLYDHDTKVNHLEVSHIVGYIEKLVNMFRPEILFIPHPGYNRDHIVAYEAAIAATRPHDTNFFIKKVLVYEGIHDFIWADKVFTPNYYKELDIEKKIQAFSFYQSQMRSHRSLESITQLAALRGKQANVPYAEAFQIKRWIE
jgi:LmbE family N-acetylglucosaminyl deacetylase